MHINAQNVGSELVPQTLRTEILRSAVLLRLSTAQAQIVALIAPSGYGKTTVLAQYSRGVSHHTLWISLVEDDVQPAILGQKLCQAVEALGVSPEEDSCTLCGQGSVQGALQVLSCMGSPLNIVLDGIEVLNEESSRWVERLAKLLPEGQRLFLSGYSLETLRLGRLMADGRALILGTAELSFDAKETAGYLEACSYRGDVLAAQMALAGWPAGVALVGAGVEAFASPADMVGEVLDALPEVLRDALPEAAVLSVWSEAAALRHGCLLPPQWIKHVQRAGLPLTPLGAGYYQPHTLLLEELHKRLGRNEERAAELYGRSAELAHSEGQFHRAMQMALRAGDVSSALNYAQTLCKPLREQAYFHSVVGILTLFSPEQLTSSLRELLALAWVETGHGERAVTLLDGTKDAAMGTDALLACLRLAARAEQNEQRLTYAEHGLIKSVLVVERSVFARARAQALLALQRGAEAQAAIEQEIVECEQSGRLEDLTLALATLQMIQVAAHDWQSARASVKRVLRLYDGQDLPLRLLPFVNNHADLERLMGHPEHTLSIVEQVLPSAQAESSEMQVFLVETCGDAQLWQRQGHSALHSYRLAMQLAQDFGFETQALRLRLKQAEAHLLLDQHEAARGAHDVVSVLGSQHAEWLSSATAFTAGLIAFYEEDWDAAQTHFQAVGSSSYEPSHAPRAALYLLAVAIHQSRVIAPLLGELMLRLKPLGSAVLAVDASALPEAVALARSVLDGAEPPSSGNFVRLEVSTLGGVRVLANGQPIKLPLMRSAEVLVRLALGGPATRDELLDALWDGSCDPRHVRYLKVALRRARTALQQITGGPAQPLVFDGMRYQLAREFEVWTDVAALRAALEHPSNEALERTLQACQGDFLPDTHSEWAQWVRLAARDEVLAAYERLASVYTQDDPVRAATLHRQALILEPLSEPHMLGLVACLSRTGGAFAVESALRLHWRFLEEAALEPTPAMTRLMRPLGLGIS